MARMAATYYNIEMMLAKAKGMSHYNADTQMRIGGMMRALDRAIRRTGPHDPRLSEMEQAEVIELLQQLAEYGVKVCQKIGWTDEIRRYVLTYLCVDKVIADAKREHGIKTKQCNSVRGVYVFVLGQLKLIVT